MGGVSYDNVNKQGDTKINVYRQITCVKSGYCVINIVSFIAIE